MREKIVSSNQVFVGMRECYHQSLIYARAYIFIHICIHAAGVWPPASYRFACMCIYLCTLSCRPRKPAQSSHIYIYSSLRRKIHHTGSDIYIYKQGNALSCQALNHFRHVSLTACACVQLAMQAANDAAGLAKFYYGDAPEVEVPMSWGCTRSRGTYVMGMHPK